MTLPEIQNDLTGLGLGDNLGLATLIYLAAAVRATPYKMSVIVEGASGTGKSFLVKTVLGIFPPQAIITLSRITVAAFVRQSDLRNSVLYVQEKFKDNNLDQLMRELLSEGEIIYSLADQEIRLQGPTTLIDTTTDSIITGKENRTRSFIAKINRSEAAQASIFEKQKERRTLEGLLAQSRESFIYEKHRQFQEGLDSQLRVVMPFARRINFFSPSRHAPRTFERILNLISAIAYLNQKRKTVHEENGTRFIEADEQDFLQAKEMLISLEVEEDEAALPGETIEFFKLLKAHRNALRQHDYFSRYDVLACLEKGKQGRTYKAIKKNMNSLRELGIIEELPVRGGKNCIRYRFPDDFMGCGLDKVEINCYAALSLTADCQDFGQGKAIVSKAFNGK